MARKTIETNLIGARVKVKNGHGFNQNKEGTVRAVYVGRESSIFGDVMVLIATDTGEMFDTFASVVTLLCDCPRVAQRMECMECGYPYSEALLATDEATPHRCALHR